MSDESPVFLYGTLRDAAHRHIVLGSDPDVEEATLPGHTVLWDAAREIPVLVGDAAQSAPGCIVRADPAMCDRMDYYEGAFGYRRRPVEVMTSAGPLQATCYFPPGGLETLAAPFDLAEWQARRKTFVLATADEVMAHFGKLSPETLERFYPSMAKRAWSRLLAANPELARRDSPSRKEVAELRRARVHTGFFALDTGQWRHPTFAGGTLDVQREVFVGFDAALVLPYDPARDLVLLVEQFRAGPLVRGEPGPWLLEPVAGLVDPGETPAEAAMRETREEAGLALDRLVPVMSGYASPGATTEYFHMFVGICALDSEAHTQSGAGLDHEGEDIRTHVLPLPDALSLIGTGSGNVVPLATLLLWAAAHRERLATST